MNVAARRTRIFSSKTRARTLFFLCGTVAVVLLGAFIVREGHRGDAVPFPTGFVGRWETTAPKYTDRFVEMSPGVLAFGTGAGGRTQHSISHVTLALSPDAAQQRYVLWYRTGDDDTLQSLEVGYNVVERTLSLENQGGIVWSRRSEVVGLTELIDAIEESDRFYDATWGVLANPDAFESAPASDSND